MDGNAIMSVVGIAGGLLCAAADCFLDLKGADNEKLGKNKYIDSKWMTMPRWRFLTSILLAMFAVPMYSMGVFSLANQMGEGHEVLANLLRLSIFWGAIGGFFIHTFLCMQPTMYKNIMEHSGFELAEKVISQCFRLVMFPFVTLYIVLVIVPAVIVVYAVITGILPVPMWCVLLNPVVFQVIGLLFRATGLKCFIDAPSICAASLGLASYGVIGLMI